MISNKNVFICSSSSDIAYILSESDKLPVTSVLIIVTGNWNMYKFLKERTQYRIIHIRSKFKGFKKPLSIFKEVQNLTSLRQQFKFFTRNSIYLYSLHHDLIGIYLSKILQKQNKLYLYPTTSEKDFEIRKTCFKTYLFRVLYHPRLKTFRSGSTKSMGLIPQLESNMFNHIELPSVFEIRSTISKYGYNPSDSKFLIILNSPEDDGENSLYKSAANTLEDILNYTKGLNIYSKGHPRLGESSVFKNHQLKIPDEIPLEFILTANCVGIIGSTSVSLANMANKGVACISILKLLHFRRIKDKFFYKEYLDIHTRDQNKIVFPKNKKDLKNEILKLVL